MKTMNFLCVFLSYRTTSVFRSIHGGLLIVALTVMALPCQATPILSRSDLFTIRKFAEFRLADAPHEPFGMLISDGSSFPTGMYITGGPLEDRTKLFHADINGVTTTYRDNFVSTESTIFAKGSYGTGMFVSEIWAGRVTQLMPDGVRSTLADTIDGFSSPFGPAQLVYGPDPSGTLPELLYTPDWSSGNVMRVAPDGTTSILASLSANQTKGIAAVTGGSYLNTDFIVSTFNLNSQPGIGQIFQLSLDGSFTPFVSGLDGVQLLTVGDSSAFGSASPTIHDAITDLLDGLVMVPSDGTSTNLGNVSILFPDGTMQEFLTNIDSTHVVFDTEGTLGGGMFVTDVGRGSIWQISAVPEPSSLSLMFIGVILLISFYIRESKTTD